MRITIVLPPVNMSGGIRVIATYARKLMDRGHAVTLVSPPPKLPSFRSRVKALLWGGRQILPNRNPASHLDGLSLNHHVLDRYRPVTDGDVPDADVVLATFWHTGPWVAALSPRKGAKAIFLQGYETSPGHEKPEIDAVWRLPLRKIVISQWMIDLSRERFGDENVFHVPNSVDLELFHAPERGKQAVPTIGFLYAHVHLKGVDVCLRAVEILRNQMPNLRVVAFGAEPVSPELALPSYVEYYQLPAQEMIRELYAVCDVWLCGSRREGFHLPPLEAMACRCPVVATKVGGPLDTVVEGVNGFLVDIEDSRGLAACVARIVSMDDEVWRRMSNAALDTARRYSWDDAAGRFEAALFRVVEDGRRVASV